MINLSRPWRHPFQRQLANRLNQCLLVFSYMGYSHGKCSFVIFIHEISKQPTVEYITCTPLSNARVDKSPLPPRRFKHKTTYLRRRPGRIAGVMVTGGERHATIAYDRGIQAITMKRRVYGRPQ